MLKSSFINTNNEAVWKWVTPQNGARYYNSIDSTIWVSQSRPPKQSSDGTWRKWWLPIIIEKNPRLFAKSTIQTSFSPVKALDFQQPSPRCPLLDYSEVQSRQKELLPSSHYRFRRRRPRHQASDWAQIYANIVEHLSSNRIN